MALEGLGQLLNAGINSALPDAVAFGVTVDAGEGARLAHGEHEVVKLAVIYRTRSLLNGNVAEFHRITTNTGAVPRRSPHFMELSKGSPNFSATLWSMPLTGMAKDFTPAHLLEGLEQRTSITVNGESLGAGITGTAAFDEGPGALDSVDLHWNKAAFPLEVYALAAYRVA